MKKGIKAVLSLILATGMLFALAACGGGTTTPSSSPAAGSGAPATPEAGKTSPENAEYVIRLSHANATTTFNHVPGVG